jgi:chromosomal replication initiation ATPase DnaA
MRVRATSQLPLPFSPDPRFVAADFREAPSNEAARAWLSRTADWPDHRLLLWGEAGCGKTHLLHIWATRIGAELWSGSSLRSLPDLPERGIAIDAADAVGDETALFHLLNAAGEASLPVLLAGRTPPSRWTIRLPDLASRLRAITAVEIGPPEDALLRALLARLLADRQLRLAEPVQDWLLLRLPRTAAAQRAAVARLDAAALEAHRDITVPFAREVLAELVASQDELSESEVPLAERPASPVGSRP